MRAYGILLLATTAALPAHAQEAPTQTAPAPELPEAEEESEDIVITGSRTQPGAVIGDIKPEQQLSPADIRSYGVSSVGELLNELSPQTSSGRGSGGGPVVLVNGRRISGFQEIRDLPTEAIQRVDILPEEVALKYGYRADQRVVNFVLRRRFKAITAELEDRLATEGGRNAPGAEIDLLRIRNNGRVNLHLEYDQADALTEAERDIRQPANATIDESAYRTLLAQTRTFAANGTYATNVFGTVGATLNATIDHNRSNGLRGLLGAGLTPPLDTIDPLSQRATTTDLHLGGALNGDRGRWRWSLTGNVDRNSSDTVTQVDLDTGGVRRPDNIARSTSTAAGLDALVAGPAFALPAGDANASIRIGASTSDFSSRSVRNAIATPADIGRDIASTQLNLDLPIASRGSGVLSAIGNLSLNGNLEVGRVSDFGTLVTLGYGANWSPLEGVRFLASITDGEAAPSATQLGSANVVTPGVRVFDYVTGTTATVTTTTGGNPALRANDSHVTKIGFDLRPWKAKDISFIANYTSQNVDDPIVSFPAASAAIEAAFPDRFVRENGQLLRIDSRPVNFARTEQSQLRYGINLSFPLKSAVQKQIEAFRAGTGPDPFAGMRPPGGERPAGEGGARPGGDGARPGGDGPRGGGFGGAGRRFGGAGGQGGGRLQFALYHTVRLTDRVLVADGGPSLDLLRGDAIGSAGGSSRHELEGQAGYSNNGLGTRLSVNYRSATRVDGGTLAAPETLNFGSLATANLRLFADLGGRLDWVKAHPWMRGTRVSLSFDNLLNTRQRVTDAAGEVPIGFQPGYLDPIGRTVRLSVRKLFF